MKKIVINTAPVLHTLFFIFVVSAIFWIPWWGLLIIFTSLRLQDLFLGGCILTKWQYGTYEKRWVEYRWLNITKVPTRYWYLIIDWGFPALLIFLAYWLGVK